jgi:hypothetical protein
LTEDVEEKDRRAGRDYPRYRTRRDADQIVGAYMNEHREKKRSIRSKLRRPASSTPEVTVITIAVPSTSSDEALPVAILLTRSGTGHARRAECHSSRFSPCPGRSIE